MSQGIGISTGDLLSWLGAIAFYLVFTNPTAWSRAGPIRDGSHLGCILLDLVSDVTIEILDVVNNAKSVAINGPFFPGYSHMQRK